MVQARLASAGLSISVIRDLFEQSSGDVPRQPMLMDWAIAALVLVATCLECFHLREEMVWRPAALILGFALAVMLPWRRRAPLLVIVAAFGVNALVNLAGYLSQSGWEGPSANLAIVMTPFALLRYATSREVTFGLLFTFPAVITGLVGHALTLGEWLGALSFVLLPASFGLIFRVQDQKTHQQAVEARAQEREHLARELHDSVAHHMSAIAVQAQAGSALHRDESSALGEVLAAIEESASRALDDMRRTVSGLRSTQGVAMAPAAGWEQIRGLSVTGPGQLAVAVEIDPQLRSVSPTLQTALHRIAQEAVTNAQRHAREASFVTVSIQHGVGSVIVRIENDGAQIPPRSRSGGFGLIGIKERVELLSGRFQAGPRPEGGWIVEVRLPLAETAT